MRKAAFLILLTFCTTVFCQQAEKRVRFFKPDFGWAVDMPFKGFAIVEAKQYDQGNFKVSAVDQSRDIMVEVYFEPGATNADNKKVRLFYESNMTQSKLERDGVSRWESSSAAYLLFTAKNVLLEPKGDELNGDLYFCKGSTWVDVRFRKPYPKPGDEALLRALLGSVKVIGAFEPSPEDNVFMGGLFCSAGFGDQCLSCLAKAYSAEKKAPRLSRELRIALCQNYADALRLKGERERALAVLDFGQSLDPNYPMYFWIRARIYGNLADEDNTVAMLEAAVRNRKGLLPGERFPDPRQDEAFKILSLKDSFKERVSKIFLEGEKKPESAATKEKTAVK